MTLKIFTLLLALSFTLFAMPNEENIDFAKIDDNETLHHVDSWLMGDFGLKPHKVNYILPFGYASREYKSYEEGVEYRNIEAELQVSLKLYLGSDLFGLGEQYYVAYSHQAFWQFYVESSPFRETNYSPEGFVVFPIDDRYSFFQLRNLKLGLQHKSNGKSQTWDKTLYEYHYQDPKNESRSVNEVYVEATLQHHMIVTNVRLWYRMPEEIGDDDNPDYYDYAGTLEVNWNYFYKKHMISLDARGNITTGRGHLCATYSYPLKESLYLYMKLFTGYGESLIDYNNNITKFSIGFSFSR